MEMTCCDICEKILDPDEIPWTLKLYRGIFTSEFINKKVLCEDCAFKIKKYIKNLK